MLRPAAVGQKRPFKSPLLCLFLVAFYGFQEVVIAPISNILFDSIFPTT
jgi:hypothetical protein